MKEKEEILLAEISSLGHTLDIVKAEREANSQELRDIRILLQSAESERDRLQADLTANEGKMSEVKESAKNQLQKAIEKVRSLTAVADSKGHEVEVLTAQLEAHQRESKVRMQNLEAELEKSREEKTAADDRCAELRNSLETALSSSAVNLQTLQEQLIALQKDLVEVA